MIEEQKIYSMPKIGDKTPSFKAKTTQGEINFPEDYKGKWVILFSHPADFTPVCTTEFMTFASMQDEFKKLNTELIGLSVDSLYAHIAWLRTIKEKIKWNGLEDVEVKFPVIEDITMEVANKYGMIFMAMAGYDPAEAIRAEERMESLLSSNKRVEILSTHPSGKNRIEAMKKFLPEAMKYYSAR